MGAPLQDIYFALSAARLTHNAFDFSLLGNTPITFPIDWHNSKIPLFARLAPPMTDNTEKTFF